MLHMTPAIANCAQLTLVVVIPPAAIIASNLGTRPGLPRHAPEAFNWGGQSVLARSSSRTRARQLTKEAAILDAFIPGSSNPSRSVPSAMGGLRPGLLSHQRAKSPSLEALWLVWRQ
ncbi:MAG: hypothetical protein JRN68_01100 [Nitrososphaerota archaeon]|nr:hypothetical protein [Nitrososphaerota archaeon]